MKGSILNRERHYFLQDIEQAAKIICNRVLLSDYYRFDEDRDYTEDEAEAYQQSLTQAKLAMATVLATLEA